MLPARGPAFVRAGVRGSRVAALLVLTEGVARATRQCPPETHPSHTGLYIAGAMSVGVVLTVLALGVKRARAFEGSRHLLAIAILSAAACAFLSFWFTVVVGMVLSGCAKD